VKLPGAGVLRLPLMVVGRTAGMLADVVAGEPAEVDDVRRRFEDLADDVGQVLHDAVDDVGHALQEAVEDVGEVFDDGAELLRSVTEESVDLVEDAFGDHRRVWEGAGRVEIEVGTAEGKRGGELRRRLKRSLEQLQGVEWAEVNAITNRVAVAFDPTATPLNGLVTVVEAAEKAYGARRGHGQPSSWDDPNRADHPADVEPVHQAIAALVGDGLGLGFSLMARAVRAPALPIELGSVVSVVETHPWLRQRLVGAIGPRAANLVLPLTNAAASSVAQGPTGILLDMAYRVSLLGELQARRSVWCQREAQFYASDKHGTVEPPELEPRPVPLPDGPIEVWSNRISSASLAGFAGLLAASRDPRWAADAFLAGLPKAARYGREGFATQLGRVLADRGVVPLDASALRRLDRVDTVVLDAATLLNGRHEVLEVVPVADGDPPDVRARVEALFDPVDVTAVHEADGWALRPLRKADAPPAGADDRAVVAGLDPPRERLEVPPGTWARVVELRRRGAEALALVHAGRVEAVVAVVAELDPAAEVVVAAVRQAGHRLVVAGKVGAVAERVGADDRIAAGRKMGRAIRRLQGDGAVVAAVARKRKTGLAAADVAINVQRRSGRPSWGADLLCGSDLTEVALIVDATSVAADVSRRSAQLAVAGSVLGAAGGILGRRATAGRRTLLLVNLAGFAALAAGAWSGVELGRRPRPRVRPRTTWHALDLEQVLHRLDAEPSGLSTWGAQRRRAARRDDDTEAGLLQPMVAELANPLTPILAAGAGLSAVTGSVVDASMVGGLIGINTVMGGVQRWSVDRSVAALLRTGANQVTTRRDGAEGLVDETDLVPGDVVVLRAGEAVPADCRLLEAVALEVDESTLTGESLPVVKSPEPCPGREVAERSCMLYQDTTIAAGEAVAVVVAVGQDTEVGASMAAAGDAPGAGGVEARLEELTRRILPASALAAAGVVATGLVRRWPAREVAGSAVSMAVAAVPEGLPFLASAAQLAAARRLAGRNAVVRNPRTIEALGRVDVLCFDKTGTLTEGRIDLRCVSDGARDHPVDELDRDGRAVLAAALRATPPQDEAVDMTDVALWAGARSAEVDARFGLGSWEVVADLPFEASRGLHAVLGRSEEGNRLCVKGAPEVVLPECATWRRSDGTHAFDRMALAQVMEHVEALAGRGLRVLAVAERVASDRSELDVERVNELELWGLVGLADPVRPTAAEAVAGIRAAGVETVMITGDHPSTAEAVAAELDMLRGRRVLTGAELDRLDDDDLAALLAEVAVFARVTPSHKVRIVSALQDAGRVVAMTGDGANDAAAIRLAHVGVALGERGTPAARDAADLVVTDDRIETIIDAIAEGRALWGSVREALAILLGGNLGEIGFTLAASFLSRRAPINARQLLLVNLFTDLLPAVAIAVRPPADTSTPTLLREGPEASLGSALSRDLTVRAVATGAGATGAWLAARATGTTGRASTVALIALVGTQLGQTVLAGRGRSPLVVAVGVGSAAVLVAIVQTPGLSHFFGCRPVGPLGWTQAATAAAVATAGSAAASRILDRRVAVALAAGPAGTPETTREAAGTLAP
jgi:cation-transporting P-type ATPase I